MAFCAKCGAELREDIKFCPSCGAAVAVAQPPTEQAAPQQEPIYQAAPQPEQQAPQQQAQNAFNNFMNTPDSSAQFTQQDVNANKGMAVLSYIGILVLIPFFAEKTSKYVRFHVIQGMYLLCLDIGVIIISILLGFIRTPHTLWGIVYYTTPWPISLITWLLSLGLLAFAIIGIVNAATGKAKELPLIGAIGKKIGIFK